MDDAAAHGIKRNQMHRALARAALRGEWAVWVATAAMLVTVTVAWFVPSLTDTYLGVRLGVPGGRLLLGFEERATLWLASIAPAIVLSYGLMQLARFFRGIRLGNTFTTSGAAAIARLGWSLLFAAAAVPAARALVMAGVARAEDVSQVAAHLAPGPVVIALAVLGVAMLALGWVLREAADIADENASFL